MYPRLTFNARYSMNHLKFFSKQRPKLHFLILSLASIILLVACSDMKDQPRYEPLEANSYFADGRASRPLPEGVVPSYLHSGLEDEAAYSPRSEDGELLDTFPFQVTLDDLQRGQERYDIFCTPCHGYDGTGQGMIVQRGFSPPPSLHEQRLREAPAGHIYEVIRDGFGRMYPYAYRVNPRDRWAIVAYIRALQLSGNASQEDVPAEELLKLESQP